jgi:hypothetical protein
MSTYVYEYVYIHMFMCTYGSISDNVENFSGVCFPFIINFLLPFERKSQEEINGKWKENITKVFNVITDTVDVELYMDVYLHKHVCIHPCL